MSEEVSKKRAEPDTARDETEPENATKKAKTALDLFREQLEYYFSIANYPTDKWMNLTAAEHNGCMYNSEYFLRVGALPASDLTPTLLSGSLDVNTMPLTQLSHSLADFADST